MTMTAYPAYHVPPACQGQIVETAYMQVGDILLRRTTDRSDLSVSYSMIALEDDSVEPWNATPTVSGDWIEISAAKAAKIANEGP